MLRPFGCNKISRISRNKHDLKEKTEVPAKPRKGVPNPNHNILNSGFCYMILERWDGGMWTGLVWLRIGTGGELL
jgi:hypothetical protein